MLRKGLMCVLALAFAWVGVAGHAIAQDDTKPLAVVSYAGYDQTMKTIELFGQLAGKPDQAAGIDAMIKMMTGGQGLQGLDPKRPWGVVVRGQGPEIGGFAFFPVDNVKELLTVLTPYLGPVTESGGLYKIERGEQTIYVKKQGKWAFAAAQTDHLEKLPEDPAKLLGDMPTQYLWGVRLFVGNLPEELRDLLVSRVQMIVEQMAQQMEGPQEELMRDRLGQSLAQMEKGLKQLDQLTVGLAVSPPARTAHFDIQATMLPGTEAAAEIAAAKPAKTEFAGFLDPKATVHGVWAAEGKPPRTEEIDKQIDAVRQQVLKQLETAGLSGDEEATARKIIDDLLDLARQTLKTGRADGGFKAILDEKRATVVAGGFLADGAKLDEVLKRVAEAASNAAPDASSYYKLNAETYKGFRLHTASAPVPQDMDERERVTKLIGEEVEIVVAVGDKAVLVSLGRGAMEALKKTIDASQAAPGKAVEPFQINLSLAPFSRFMSVVGDENVQLAFERISEQISDLAGKDSVRLTISPIARGVQIRLLAEEGALKALANFAPPGMPVPGP